MNAQYIVSYGSLLSHESRTRYSGITASVMPVIVTGWKRAWCTRHFEEHTTHAGAVRTAEAKMNGVLVPTTITDEIRHRERYYQFVQIDRSTLQFPNRIPEEFADGTFWICEPRQIDHSTKEYPLAQSYVDTCLTGCLESNIPAWPYEFIRGTDGWDHYWVNDRNRDNLIFPRAARLSQEEFDSIDGILKECDILDLRRHE